MQRVVAMVLMHLALAASVTADLTNPSTLVIEQTSPSRFTVELTLPVINGRIVKAKPILPEACVADGAAEVSGDALKAIRTWTMTCDPAQLVGAPVGIHGLLGTALDVRLTIETLDGRQHVQQLRATQAFFVVPPPPTFADLAFSAGRRGVERVLRRPELALLILISMLIGIGGGQRRRALVMALAAFVLGQVLGQWLAGQRWMVMSAFLPQVIAAGTAWLIAVELMGRPILRPGWWQPLAVPMVVLGLLYGAAHRETVPTMGLSTGEQRLSLLLFAAGAMAGLLLLTLWGHQLLATLAGLPDGSRKRWTKRIGFVSAVLAGGVFFYRMSAPYFGGGMTPEVPLVTLLTAAALGLCCRRDGGTMGLVLAIAAAAACATGVSVSFYGVLPLASVAVFGLLALVGARLVAANPLPLGLTAAIVVVTALYQGFHAGSILRHNATLPVANAAGMGVLLAAVFFICYRAVPADPAPSLRMPGFLVMALAVIWQLAELRDWWHGPVSTDLAMGLARLPVLAMVLLLGTFIAWPRRRRFASHPGNDSARVHWALLGLAFFLLPIGTLRLDIPFHTPDAPSAAEASRVISSLLSDTYLAFNLDDEDAAFDRLALNLSQDLVADVYLDSRRRLTAGTREGAVVTVRDVDVREVDDAVGTADNAFTYPCQWVVTARVRHLQHIHNRQNVYAGELTIQVEDNRWKIAGLDLFSEERIVMSWTQS